MNCGYGHGFSVREVVAMLRKVTGRDFTVVETGRRAGDPPALIADSTKLQVQTGWQPRHDDLEFIIRTAWDWENRGDIKRMVLQNRSQRCQSLGAIPAP